MIKKLYIRKLWSLPTIIVTMLVTTSVNNLAIEETSFKTTPSITISIHSGNTWLGMDDQYNLSVCKLDRDTMKVKSYRTIQLNQKEIEILHRFLLIKEVLKHQKENKALGESQGLLLKGQITETTDPKEKIKKTTHLKVWINGELKEAVLINDDITKDIWPEDIKYLLKLLSNAAKNSEPVEVQGIGFTQSLEHYKDPKTKWKQYAQMLNNQKPFHKVSDQEFSQLPKHLQTILAYPGFIAPLSNKDLELLTTLGWTDLPEENKPSAYDLWWGIVEYNSKTYGLNAWVSDKKVSNTKEETD
jgi:hypothetical protein